MFLLQAAGQTGRIVNIDDDGDLKIAINNGNTWVLNPRCCTREQGSGSSLTVVRRTSDDADDAASKSYRYHSNWPGVSSILKCYNTWTIVCLIILTLTFDPFMETKCDGKNVYLTRLRDEGNTNNSVKWR